MARLPAIGRDPAILPRRGGVEGIGRAQPRPPCFAAGAAWDTAGRFFGVNSIYGVPTLAFGERAAGMRSPLAPSERTKRYSDRRSSSLMSRRANHGIGGSRSTRANLSHSA